MTHANSDTTQAQQRLIDCLRREEEQYAAATAVIEKLSLASSSGQPQSAHDVTLLQKHLKGIRTIGEQTQAAVKVYQQENQPACAELTTELQRQAERLQNFLVRINTLTHTFTEAKDRMRSDLDGEARRHAMQQAYSRSLRTG